MRYVEFGEFLHKDYTLLFKEGENEQEMVWRFDARLTLAGRFGYRSHAEQVLVRRGMVWPELRQVGYRVLAKFSERVQVLVASAVVWTDLAFSFPADI